MLQKLNIKHYAIIDELEIGFTGGLNIITGETGAGKSILMGALSLILGERADSSVLQDQGKKCIIEGIFKTNGNKSVAGFLQANDLDNEQDILVRREIAANGKSRSFINDTPVTLAQLRALSILLVDLHQQYDSLDLGNVHFQREVLDAFAGNAGLLATLKEKFANYLDTKKELDRLTALQQDANATLDYNRFLFTELDELALKENELEELDAELKLLSNAEHIKQELLGISYELKDSEQPLVHQLKQLQNKLSAVMTLHPGLEPVVKQLGAAVIDIRDVADEIEHTGLSVSHDPARIDWINDRLSAGYKLLKKHGVQETGQLLQIREQLQQKLDTVLNLSVNIEKIAAALKLRFEECSVIAKQVSANRAKQAKPFAEKVNKLLVQVGMPNALLKISLRESALSAFGTDEVEFLFDANKSNRFEPLGNVASGGELSRLMLSIKSLVAKKLELPTLIFDEIDTGISGEAARQVGIIMKDLSAGHQVIAITHQPQIAAKATSHYFVYKEINKDRIVTSVRKLDNDERITAIAKMLGGEKPTAAALENAREMVGN